MMLTRSRTARRRPSTPGGSPSRYEEPSPGGAFATPPCGDTRTLPFHETDGSAAGASAGAHASVASGVTGAEVWSGSDAGFLGFGVPRGVSGSYPSFGVRELSSRASFELNARCHAVSARWFAPRPYGCSSSAAASLSEK